MPVHRSISYAVSETLPLEPSGCSYIQFQAGLYKFSSGTGSRVAPAITKSRCITAFFDVAVRSK